MNKEDRLNPNWLKGRMFAEKIIAFSAYNTMKVDTKQDVVEIVAPQDIIDSIKKKADKLEVLEKEIEKKIVLNVE